MIRKITYADDNNDSQYVEYKLVGVTIQLTKGWRTNLKWKACLESDTEPHYTTVWKRPTMEIWHDDLYTADFNKIKLVKKQIKKAIAKALKLERCAECGKISRILPPLPDWPYMCKECCNLPDGYWNDPMDDYYRRYY